MGRPLTKLLPVLLATATLLAACLEEPPRHTVTASPKPNACTSVEEPQIDQRDQDTFRGTNAFAYTIGLICDHAGPYVRERPRVPGTPGHEEGAAFLADTLRANGFQASFQNFSGEQYEAVMQEKTSSRAHYYYASPNYCDANELGRLRGIDFANLVGKGGNVGGPIFLLMAHWDSKRFAEGSQEPVLGANDGAAGVGVLLELSRLIEPDETRMEIRILLTDGEDGFEDCHPLAGSMFYADRLTSDERMRLSAGRILLLDMIGDPKVSFYKGCGSDHDLADRIWAAARILDVPQFKDSGGCSVVDDHTPFEEAGLKAVDIIPTFGTSNSVPYWHTTQDTPDKLDDDMMGDIGRILLRVLADLGDEVATLP